MLSVKVDPESGIILLEPRTAEQVLYALHDEVTRFSAHSRGRAGLEFPRVALRLSVSD